MSYFGFLVRFLVIPIGLLLIATIIDWRRGKFVTLSLRRWPWWAAILLHVLIALAYTTPWDNYLVATQVWWYDRSLVTGLTLGWVPIEEYTFFVLQPVLAGLWLHFLARRLGQEPSDLPARFPVRIASVTVLSVIWLVAVGLLASGRNRTTYLALELAWALPPISLQLIFGADLLWRYRRLVLAAIAPITLYLSAVDALAIRSGTWTISPEQSIGLLIGGVLPVEELLFFLLTTTLVTFGVTLVQARESHDRLRLIRRSPVMRKLAAMADR